MSKTLSVETGLDQLRKQLAEEHKLQEFERQSLEQADALLHTKLLERTNDRLDRVSGSLERFADELQQLNQAWRDLAALSDARAQSSHQYARLTMACMLALLASFVAFILGTWRRETANLSARPSASVVLGTFDPALLLPLGPPPAFSAPSAAPLGLDTRASDAANAPTASVATPFNVGDVEPPLPAEPVVPSDSQASNTPSGELTEDEKTIQPLSWNAEELLQPLGLARQDIAALSLGDQPLEDLESIASTGWEADVVPVTFHEETPFEGLLGDLTNAAPSTPGIEAEQLPDASSPMAHDEPIQWAVDQEKSRLSLSAPAAAKSDIEPAFHADAELTNR